MARVDRMRFARACAPFVFVMWIACGDEGGSGSSDLPESISAEVGVKGGTLKTRGVTLEIPEGALDKTVTLSIENKGKSAPSSLMTKQLSDTHEFGPAGTKFKKEVQVTFVTDEDHPKSSVYFTKENSTEFEKVRTEQKQGKVTAKVMHFSQGFVGVPLMGDAGADDLDAAMGMPDSGAEPFDAGGGDASDDDAAVMLPARITVRSKNLFGVATDQTWAAYQDGDGAWQALPPSGTTGRYEFDVTSGRYGVAFVCVVPEYGFASGTVYYAPRSRTTLDVEALGEGCNPYVPSYSMSGPISVPNQETYVWYGTSSYSYTSQFGSGPSYSAWYAFRENMETDLVLGIATGSDDGLTKVRIARNIALTADVTNAPMDFVNAGEVVGSAVATANGASANTQLSVLYTTRGTEQGMRLGQGATLGSTIRVQPFATIPENVRLTGDRYVFKAEEYTNTAARVATLTTYATGDLSVTMPKPFTATFSSIDTPYYRPSISFADVPEATSYASEMSYYDNQYVYRMIADAQWFEQASSHTLTFPDLSAASGFDVSWMPPSGLEAGSVFVSAESRVEAGELETISRITGSTIPQ